MNPKTLGELIALMKDGPVVKLPRREEWSDMIARLNVPGRVCEVEEETYDYFLEVLPPRWMGRGAGFALVKVRTRSACSGKPEATTSVGN